jgi:glycosyltransferase involved in cell wall biosynthesis
MGAKLAVITPCSKGLEHVEHLLHDMNNQTFRDFEHFIIRDGYSTFEMMDLISSYSSKYKLWYTAVIGGKSEYPGTIFRNYGLEQAKHCDYVVFCDDDDRYKSTYLETLMSGIDQDTITICQMTVQESRIWKDASPYQFVNVPRVGDKIPNKCLIGTPCFCVPYHMAVKATWHDVPDHDFDFINRICKHFEPKIRVNYSAQIDVDGLTIKNLKDWI